MSDIADNEARQRILEAAETLFASRGYSAVKLRDIAQAVGMKHASLYYYVHGGKEQLFIAVFEYSFSRHRDGIEAAIQGAGESLCQQLYAVADWFTDQSAIDLERIQQGDRPSISIEEMQRLSFFAYDALRMPLYTILERAKNRGEIEVKDINLAVMALINMVRSTCGIPGIKQQERIDIGHELVDMLLDGLRTRSIFFFVFYQIVG
ncbi:MAG: DNA-binding transcriptional regulator, AcrR family [Chloroflexi bacterium AL-W]|nr:DNA-binding transcriptional regulator, AcrR family [Chloroflexi bacterium AL-N1]NOK71203.1 DNA-binding transcriptional regulator, AcrR family [Chloroflexi bacterium AL-N10]NOK76492.1 DNA-binding transcriptional regulator, AcrR family [Chloroflexi bacterium AL-N5]NOK83609.1 DNA-binding transcriptional regulator, AcrR family [Chloroflexi bacterium AL-W]NOK92269.1 DNA-binding transcriptional regulator, AcrR family [Chloroflexi bacterium AL-N15]